MDVFSAIAFTPIRSNPSFALLNWPGDNPKGKVVVGLIGRYAAPSFERWMGLGAVHSLDESLLVRMYLVGITLTSGLVRTQRRDELFQPRGEHALNLFCQCDESLFDKDRTTGNPLTFGPPAV